MELHGFSPTRNGEYMLRILGTKVAAGRDLTLVERLMAMTAAGRVMAGNFGPGPADMVTGSLDLPESVKGMLADYAS